MGGITTLLDKLRKYGHFLFLLYYIVIYHLYKYTETINAVPKYVISSKIDYYIPFVKEMVVPYLFWYIYILMAIIYFGFKSKEDYYRLISFMFVGMTACYFIYMIYPNGQNLRPVIQSNDFFSNLIKNIYLNDTPTNTAPSIHVLDSLAVHFSIIKSNEFKDNKIMRSVSFVIMSLIIASTVMIKQHSIIDIIYGIALSFILYFVIYEIDIIGIIKSKKYASEYID
ncbi:phosphatidic acid phosphatase [Marinitoga sp. 1135]|nr:phosphatidic acid phosphatase [Marinitoga sp. 1135]